MTNEEMEQQLKQQEEDFFAKLNAEFDYMDDASAEIVINSLKSVDQQIADATYKASVEQKSLEWAAKQVKEAQRQAEIKRQQDEWIRTAEQREQQRIDALEKARRVYDSAGPKYDVDGNSNQRVPEPEPSDSEFLNAFERQLRR